MTELVVELLDWCRKTEIPDCFTFVSFYTCLAIPNHINALKDADDSKSAVMQTNVNSIASWCCFVSPADRLLDWEIAR